MKHAKPQGPIDARVSLPYCFSTQPITGVAEIYDLTPSGPITVYSLTVVRSTQHEHWRYLPQYLNPTSGIHLVSVISADLRSTCTSGW